MKASDTQTSILDAAVAVYGRGGSQGFSMRQVAAEVGITATAIYRHYPDKAALAEALIERARRTFGGYLLAGLAGDDSLERLWSCADSYTRFVREHPQLYRLLFLDPLPDAAPDADAIRHREQAGPFHFMIDRIREAMDDGFIDRGDPAHMALSAWAHLHGLCALFLAGRIPPADLEATVRGSVQHLYKGLRRRNDDE